MNPNPLFSRVQDGFNEGFSSCTSGGAPLFLFLQPRQKRGKVLHISWEPGDGRFAKSVSNSRIPLAARRSGREKLSGRDRRLCFYSKRYTPPTWFNTAEFRSFLKHHHSRPRRQTDRPIPSSHETPRPVLELTIRRGCAGGRVDRLPKLLAETELD